MGRIELVRTYDARSGGREHSRVTGMAGADEPRVFLVDRLWPCGVAKSDLPHDRWLREAAPSTGLRDWFGHDPQRFEEFADRYAKELDERRESAKPLIDASARGDIVLLYSARDTEHNQAVVLRRWINSKR